MATSKQLKKLATSPADYMRFMTTGKLPQGVRPASQLISLLESLAPADRIRITSVVVDERLGYAGSRRFANAEQAYRWVKPSDEVFDSFPAESWRIKSFDRRLVLTDLAACSDVPERLLHAPGRAGIRFG